MKTTLIATDRTGMEILEHCGAIADVTCTRVTQPEALPQGGGTLITVSHGDDIGWLTKPRSSVFEQEVNYVIIPYGQRKRLEEIHSLTAGRNVVFIPQLPVKAADEAEYYSHCILDAAESIKALIKLIKSYCGGFMAIDANDLDIVLSYGDNTYKAIFSVKADSIEDCIEKVTSHRLIRVKPVMALYEAFFSSMCQLEHLNQINSAFNKAKYGLMLDECEPQVVIVAVYDRSPEE